MAPAAKNLVDMVRDLAVGHNVTATDGELLDAYCRSHDRTALSTLVRRHSAMVWGVCRRLLGTGVDAEDAFQATFLVFVEKATSIREPSKLGNWLYGVAQKTAVRARALRAKQAHREKQVEAIPERAERIAWISELEAILDEELSRLPEIYRVAIVLCDLEGRPRTQVAKQLGCPDGTIAARLSRGRELLAARILRRGVQVTAALLAAVLGQQAASAAPASLITTAIDAATTGMKSASVAALTQAVLRSMAINQVRSALLTLMIVLAFVGAGYMACSATAPRDDPAAPEVIAVQARKARFVEATGKLEPSQSVWVYPAVHGTLSKWHCTNGAEIRKGQKIATVTSFDMEQQLDKLRAEMEICKAKIAVLSKEPKMGPAEVLAEERVRLDRHIKTFNALDQRYAGGVLTSPLDGTVIIAEPNAMIGKGVTDADPICRVVRRNAEWQASVWFAERDVGRLLDYLRTKKDGAEVELVVPAVPDKKLKGTLRLRDVADQMIVRENRSMLFGKILIHDESLHAVRTLPIDTKVHIKISISPGP